MLQEIIVNTLCIACIVSLILVCIATFLYMLACFFIAMGDKKLERKIKMLIWQDRGED